MATDHWDGYTDQEIIFYDDIHCDCMNPNSVTYKEIISLVSSSPFNPNYAQLEKKQNFISPKYVVMTTNFPYPNYLCDMSALCRRHGFLIYCLPTKRPFTTDFTHIDFYLLPSPLPPKNFVGGYGSDPFLFEDVESFHKHPFYKQSRLLTLYELLDIVICKAEIENEIFESCMSCY